MLYGYDISHWQGSDTVKTILEKKPAFIFCKATEGKSHVDKACRIHVDAITNYPDGPILGLYHYARAEKNQPCAEAEHFVNECKKMAEVIGVHHVLLALDFEGLCFKLKPDEQNAWAVAWLDYVYGKTGIKPLLYVQESKLVNFPDVPKRDYGLWCAKWGTKKPKCSPWPFWAFWQDGQYDIGGGKEVDHNVFNGSYEQLLKYGGRVDGIE